MRRSLYIFASAFYLFIYCVSPFICNCLRGHFFPQFPLQLFFYSTFRVWKMKAFWVRNDQGQTPEAKEYTDTVQSATDPTQTTMSAKISNNQQDKKLSNGAKEGWGGWGQREKDNTFTNSDHWVKFKQIFVVQFVRLFANMKRKCIVPLNWWVNKRTKAKKKEITGKQKMPPAKLLTSHPDENYIEKSVWIHLLPNPKNTGSKIKPSENCSHQGDKWWMGVGPPQSVIFFKKLHSSESSAGHNGSLSVASRRRSLFVIM